MVREGKQAAPARPTVEEATGILMKNPHAVFQNATETLFQVVKNLTSHPDEPKYRTLKRSSNAFSSKLAPAVGAVRFLRAIGFVEQGSSDAADGVFTMEKPDDALEAWKELQKAQKSTTYAALMSDAKATLLSSYSRAAAMTLLTPSCAKARSRRALSASSAASFLADRACVRSSASLSSACSEIAISVCARFL